VASKGLAGTKLVCVANRGLTRGQFPVKPDKTRRLSICVANKRDR
jgi:hypothetical protein